MLILLHFGISEEELKWLSMIKIRQWLYLKNMGDVIFVKEFDDFTKETGFTIYLCKGYDPSTKGKVEKTVDYVKHQFLDGGSLWLMQTKLYI